MCVSCSPFLTIRKYSYFSQLQVDSRGYLAQHDVLGQINELREDVHPLPSFCSLQPSKIRGNQAPIHTDRTTNFWFGEKGCFSPLHTDPLDNFFFQVVA